MIWIIGQRFQALGWDDFSIKNVSPPQVKFYFEAFLMENEKRGRDLHSNWEQEQAGGIKFFKGSETSGSKGFLCIEGQPGLNNEFQDTQDYREREREPVLKQIKTPSFKGHSLNMWQYDSSIEVISIQSKKRALPPLWRQMSAWQSPESSGLWACL